jgi:hypothetical protein
MRNWDQNIVWILAVTVLLMSGLSPAQAQEYLLEEQCALSIPLEELRQYAEDTVLELAGEDYRDKWVWTHISLDYGAEVGNQDDYVNVISLFETRVTGWINATVTASLQILDEEPSPNPYSCYEEAIDPETGETIVDPVTGGVVLVPIPMEFPNVVLSLSCDSTGSERECEELWASMGGQEQARCETQNNLQSEFDRLMNEQIFQFGSTPYTVRNLIVDSGGIKINQEFIHFLVPSIEGCEEDSGEMNRNCQLSGLTFNFFNDHVDVSRTIREKLAEFEALNADADETNDIELFGLRLICNHGRDCTAIGDEDGDGFCNDVDYCPDTFTGGNFDHDGDGRGDGMGEGCEEADWIWSSELRSCRRECDNCPDTPNPPDRPDGRQSDFDADGIGDACDPDLDNDMVVNDWDCREFDSFRGADLDRDGVCDDSDNCIYVDAATDPFCQDALACAEDPDASCGIEVWEDCAAQYGNSFQSDWDGDGLGDQCDTGITHLELVPELTGMTVQEFPYVGATQTCITTGGVYRIEFRAQGGGLALDGSGFEPEVRTGVAIAACGCANAHGWWSDDLADTCWEACPIAAYYDPDVGTPPLEWNVISSTSLGPTAYPIYPGFRADRVEAAWAAIDRQINFTRDPTTNFHSLRWYWQNARRFEEPRDPIDYDADAGGGQRRTTRVRAYWPDYDGAALESERSVPYALGEVVADCAGLLPSPYDIMDVTAIAAASDTPWSAVPDFEAPVRAAAIAREEAEGEFVLFGLGGAAMEMSAVANVGFPDSPSSSAALHLAVGFIHSAPSQAAEGVPQPRMRSHMTQAQQRAATATVFVYQEPGPENGKQPARLFIGELRKSLVNLQDTAELFNLPAPQLTNAQMLVAPNKRELLLLGSESAGEAPAWQLWRLDLDRGAWTGSAKLATLGGRSGLSLALDRNAAKLVVFGGHNGGKETDAVVLIDLETFAAKTIPTSGAGPKLAREQAGSFFDAATQKLYVCGGKHSGEVVDDCWRLELAARTWSPLGRGCEERGGLTEPLVVFDPQHQRLMVAPRTGTDSHRGLDVCVREPDGRWHSRTERLAPIEAAWPARDAYLPGAAHTYVKRADAGKGAGQLVLAHLKTKAPELGLRIYDHFAEPLAVGRRTEGRTTVAAFFCPRGQNCQIAVGPSGEREPPAWSPFFLNVLQAKAVMEDYVTFKKTVRDVAVRGNYLFVTDDAGLSVLSCSDLSVVGDWRESSSIGVRQVVNCGANLCVSRPEANELVILDVDEPQKPVVKNVLATIKPVLDMVGSGSHIYVAQGVDGIRVFDLNDARKPRLSGVIQIPEGVTRIELSQKYLAAATNGHVYLYERPRGGKRPVPFAKIPLKDKLNGLKLYANQLWLLRDAGRSLQVWDVHKVGKFKLLGTFPFSLAEFEGSWYGDRKFRVVGNRLQAWVANTTK